MSHITQEQRYTISQMLLQGKSQKEISQTIGKDKSVVSREITRNRDQRSGRYCHHLASRKCYKRHKEKGKHQRFTPDVQSSVESLIRADYSPEQVVGSLRKQNLPCVSVERIYQHIWSNKRQGGNLYEHLRRRGRKYQKRGSRTAGRGLISNRVSIEQRPKIVEQRKRFGDIEIDLIIGKNHQSVIVTANDRASGVLKMKKAQSKKAKEVAQTVISLLEEWKPYIKTITSDNGKEFAEHEKIAEELAVDFFFAHPYHSWERGSNENLNGLVRQYIPKKTDFENFTDQQINEFETKINTRPRKRYSYENPILVMEKLLFKQELHL